MPSVILTLILGTALLSISTATVYRRLTCDEFSKDSTFAPHQAVGDWYLVQLRPYDAPADDKCVHFSVVGDQERQELQAKIGKYATDLKWKNLALKMQVPCAAAGHNRTRDYFLEKLDVAPGAFNALLMPPPSAKLVLTYFNQQHEMRLKLVEGKYLAMMDCVEQFTFLLDKQPYDKPLDPALAQILQPYLPEEH